MIWRAVARHLKLGLGLGLCIGLGACGADDVASSASSASTEDEAGDDGCTDETCDSTLTVVIQHALPLADGPHSLTMSTPLFDVECSVTTDLSGAESCFGFRFANIEWDASTITVTLTEPFFDTDTNPDAEPFASVGVLVEHEGTTVADETVAIEAGAPLRPDPCGPVCWPATGNVDIR